MLVGLTATIAIIGSALILILKAPYALSVYCVVVFCYPDTQTIPVGPIDLSAARIAIVALLANALFRSGLLKSFRWNTVDTFVLLYLIGRLVAVSQTVPTHLILTREGGRLCDQFLPYFAARLILTTKDNFFVFLKTLFILGAPLAVLGIYQCLTGHNPIGFLYAHPGLAERKGLWRASGTFGNYLGFGLFFAVLAPLCLGLLRQKTWRRITVLISFALLMVGVISSMSSGPLMSIIVAFAFIACFPIRRAWVALVVVLVSGLLWIEFFSNRHFYEVLDRVAFNPLTAQYRTGLIEEAFGGGMTGYWVEGYGYVGIGETENVNEEFDWYHIDMVNLYIGVLVRTGLLGVIPFLLVNFYPYRCLYLAGMKCRNSADLWLVFCFAGALFGWHNAMMTCGAVTQTRTLLFLLFAAASGMPQIIQAVPVTARKQAPLRQGRVGRLRQRGARPPRSLPPPREGSPEPQTDG